MRNQWRLLLRHHHHRLHSLSSPTPTINRPLSLLHHHQVNTSPTSSFSLSSILPHHTSFNPTLPSLLNSLFLRHYSSDPSSSTEEKIKSPEHSLLLDIFSKPINNDDIKNELDSKNLVFTHDLVYNVLKDLKSSPHNAIKFFDWVLERESERISSKSYNLMLGILGSNGFVKEFWDVVGTMKKLQYCVSKDTFVKVSEKFEKDGLQADLEKLRGWYLNASTHEACSRISKLVKKQICDENVEKELQELRVTYSSELVKLVLEKLSTEPMKGLLFFRWVEESGVFKHDERTYNTMAIVLGREDCLDIFWNVVSEMRSARHDLEMDTYIKVLRRFIRMKLLKDAVNLYEVAMDGVNKPPPNDCAFLLRKLAVAKELEMELFSRVLKAFREKGFAVRDSMLDAVLKSLTSVGRRRECNKVLEAMTVSGFRPSGAMQGRVAFDLSSSKMKDEASEVIQKLEEYGLVPDFKTWACLIEGYCVAGDLEKAKDCFEKMIERKGVSYAGYAFNLLVNAYCNSDRAIEVCDILSELAKRENLKPWHTTYKTLISKLLVHSGFQEALGLLGLMKNHRYSPFLDPFMSYLSKRGTADEAILFFKAVSVKRFPSTNVVRCLFEAFSEAGRHKEAQNVLAKCPRYIRNHADILNLFCSMRSEKPVKPAAMAAA